MDRGLNSLHYYNLVLLKVSTRPLSGCEKRRVQEESALVVAPAIWLRAALHKPTAAAPLLRSVVAVGLSSRRVASPKLTAGV